MVLEVLEIVMHFIISLLVIAGGGYLMFTGKGDSQFVIAMITLVISFWFQGSHSRQIINTMNKQAHAADNQQPSKGKDV